MATACVISVVEPVMPQTGEINPQPSYECDLLWSWRVRGRVLQSSQLCKGGHWHDKKHYPTSAGSASYQPPPLSGSKSRASSAHPLCLTQIKGFTTTYKTSPLSVLFGEVQTSPQKSTLCLCKRPTLWVIASCHVSLSLHPKKHEALNQLASHTYGFKDKQMEGWGFWKEVSPSLINLHLPHSSISHLLPLSSPWIPPLL